MGARGVGLEPRGYLRIGAPVRVVKGVNRNDLGVLVGSHKTDKSRVDVKWYGTGTVKDVPASCLEYINMVVVDAEQRKRDERERMDRQILESEIMKRERVGRERQTLADADWKREQASIVDALQSEVESLKSEVASLKAERQSSTASSSLSSFSPSALEGVQTLTKRARVFDSVALSGAVENLETYLPLVQGITAQAEKLREFIKENKRSELVPKECSTLSASLAKMHSAYHTSLASLTAVDFKPEDAMEIVRSAITLLSALSSVRLVPLPQDTAHLTLLETRKYIQVEQFNQAVRELVELVGPIIDIQATMEQYMKDLECLETPDTEALTALDQECVTLLDTLNSLAKDQAEAETLLELWEQTPHVTQAQADDEQCEADDEQCEVEVLQFRLKKMKSKPAEERAPIEAEIATRQQTLASMQHSIQERATLTRELAPYTHLPKVAQALGQPQTPLETALQNQAVRGVGMMVKKPVC
ncbi:hypothetical protein KIPB_002371 [Kipferlia bialata]|uniref:Uncharacterized protein n=1 Tax=Kipferlia bialata TaxID=797122 RepID=A0A9K3GGK8_9EUKA|nr:hypothetical protein KIPB_002371 [Kipferlia bialata]|eukprot:g2371.t1